jgi:uncharacterized OB-fold protein
MKHPAPRLQDAAPMWREGARQTLVLPHCAGCSRYVWPPRGRCPECGGTLEWHAAGGRATLATFSVVRRAVDPDLGDSVPYVVAIVALEEGVRLFTNIVDAQPDTLAIGMRLRCRFERTTDEDAWVPVFAPET